MSDTEQARRRWISERPQFEKFGLLVQSHLQAHLKPLGIWFEVTSRAKDVDSLVKKLLRKTDHTFETLPDKVGARVVIRYRCDIAPVVERIKERFEVKSTEDKVERLGTDKVGYQSVHVDGVRFRTSDPESKEFPPEQFWLELQVRTLAQHLWSDMSHDTIYKNDETISELPDDIKRRANLMAGQIEVADREFDRLNSETSQDAAVRLLHALERHYYSLSSKRPDIQLSIEVLRTFLPLAGANEQSFLSHLNEFLEAQHQFLQSVYEQAGDRDPETSTAFLYQPEVLFLYDRLTSDFDNTRRLWNEHYPEPELQRIANTFGISFD